MSKRNLYRVESAKNAARITMLLEAGTESLGNHRDSHARDSYPESPTYGDGRMQPVSKIKVDESQFKTKPTGKTPFPYKKDWDSKKHLKQELYNSTQCLSVIDLMTKNEAEKTLNAAR